MAASALGLAQAGAGFAGSASEAASARLQGEIEEQQAGFNARVSEFQSEEAIRKGQREAELARRSGKKLIGKQRAALAAQGIALDEGTALALQEEAAALTAGDVEAIKNNASAEAFGFKVRAGQERLRGRLAGIAGRSEATSTLLGAGAKFFDQGIRKSGVVEAVAKSDIFKTEENITSGEKISNVDAVFSRSSRFA